MKPISLLIGALLVGASALPATAQGPGANPCSPETVHACSTVVHSATSSRPCPGCDHCGIWSPCGIPCGPWTLPCHSIAQPDCDECDEDEPCWTPIPCGSPCGQHKPCDSPCGQQIPCQQKPDCGSCDKKPIAETAPPVTAKPAKKPAKTPKAPVAEEAPAAQPVPVAAEVPVVPVQVHAAPVRHVEGVRPAGLLARTGPGQMLPITLAGLCAMILGAGAIVAVRRRHS